MRSFEKKSNFIILRSWFLTMCPPSLDLLSWILVVTLCDDRIVRKSPERATIYHYHVI